ncbi:MAG TPA: membrane protein insertion efficiency factor YidD [Candidatus Acidoferrum sp.]|nr:membrane protein insertion efficiency factor YidD [Candidatus Acidoferrum sp.]
MSLLSTILILAIRIYRLLISPAQLFLFGPAGGCRYQPSCSEFAVEAIQTHGVWRGSALTAGRICRCHPWGGCGPDPVPKPAAERAPRLFAHP